MWNVENLHFDKREKAAACEGRGFLLWLSSRANDKKGTE